MGDTFPHLTTAAATLIDTLGQVEPNERVVVIAFDPAAGSTRLALYSNAAAIDLVPMLRIVLARLESGTLRMPVTNGVRWVDVGEAG
jgi:hypothetical protein